MKKPTTYLVVTTVLSLLLIACGGPQVIPITVDERDKLKSYPEIKVVHSVPPMMDFMTPGGVLLDQVTLGTVPIKDKAKRYGVPDPAASIKENMARGMERELGLRNLVRVAQPGPRDAIGKVDAIKSAFGKGMVLEVTTFHWGAGYFPADWTHYRVGYGAQARLVHVNDGRIIWKSMCNYDSYNQTGVKPSMDELTANNGAVLKQIVGGAEKYCTDLFINQFFGRAGKM